MKSIPAISGRWSVLLIVAAVLALRLPFLNQAIQGDDYYYLSGAMHAQIDPLHPTHGEYAFAGQMVDVRGHPHPPLNMWILGGLLAALGDIYEVPFHAVYILFSMLAALSMWSLARRFSPAPEWAVLLFLAVPSFVINGSSLEADIPFLAFWMASAAAFIRAADCRSHRWLGATLLCLIPAALGAYQSVALIPILGCYLFLNQRNWLPGWAVLLAPAAVLGGWQLFERITGGAMPAGVLAGYFESYGLQAIANKLDNAVSLTVHLGWMTFPLLAAAAFLRLPRALWIIVAAAVAAGALWIDPHPLFWFAGGVGIVILLRSLLSLMHCREKDTFFLSVWLLMFFGGALLVFFAGSARYLLPVAAPLCLLITRYLRDRTRWLAIGFVLQLALSVSLATVNCQHWGGYRDFVSGLHGELEGRRVWVNAEWGLRFYAEAEGALALLLNQPVQPGDLVLASEISYPIEYSTGGGQPVLLESREIRPALPLRIFGLGARSGYSTATQGYRALDIVNGPIDRVTAHIIVERSPELLYLPMNAPEAEHQIVSGLYQLEDGAWRWTAEQAVILLKTPEQPAPVQAEFYIPEQAPAREIILSVNGVEVARRTYEQPGSHVLASSEPVAGSGGRIVLTLSAGRTFSPPGDQRKLGVILSAAGFRQ